MMNESKERDEALVAQLKTQRVKVHTTYNPFMNKSGDTLLSIKTIEDIHVYHRKTGTLRLMGEVLKDKQVKRRHKRRIVKDSLKLWDREFKEELEKVTKEHTERIKRMKKRRVKRMNGSFIAFFLVVSLLGFLLIRQFEPLLSLPLVGRYIDVLFDHLGTGLFYYSLYGLTYLGLITALYLMVIQTYFELFRNVGGKAEKHTRVTLAKLQKHYKGQYKRLRRHLNRTRKSRFYKKQLPIEKIYDPHVVIAKLDEFGASLDERIGNFNKHYLKLRLVGLLLQLATLCLIGYVGYQFYGFI